ncbi:hypothetical protein B0A55_05366 [Friedmanniomyces simplex]|uniref:Alpha/beta hydrolase fold-3 domain-containing protein n=1 Tax=Friedmanniomyces simplex TaxID=329884 RepID=A0A4U0XJW1_9PEZI|nr:hypothetical protein B0A55_05366 [Friedmanniomyces simplex]
MELYQEPRLDSRLLAVLSALGLDRMRTPPSLATLSPSSTLDEARASLAQAEEASADMYELLPNNLPRDSWELQVENRTVRIVGSDANLIALQIYRPVVKGGALPCVVYSHGGGGGGVYFTSANDKVHRRWCISLAAQGLIVVNVDYRNARTATNGFPMFPAALNDVCFAVKFVYNHREDLNTRNIVLHGDGGGANLALAAAIKAKREGWLNRIDGVYTYSPFISNAYTGSLAAKLAELPSLIECDGYVINVHYMAYIAHSYTPLAADAAYPLAWPYHTSKEDLEGLPPHVVVMDELSPLRSEGEAYLRKLVSAGVKAVGHVNLGSVQGACLAFRQAVPEMHQDLVRNIAAFAKQA